MAGWRPPITPQTEDRRDDIEALQAAGANQMVLDKENNTPLQTASKHNRSCSMREVPLASWAGFAVGAMGGRAIAADGVGTREAAREKARSDG